MPPRLGLGTLDQAMSEAQATEPQPLSEVLTWKQICERFPDQWPLPEEPPELSLDRSRA